MDNNWNFIVGAYSVTWVVLLGYLSYVHRALARARAEHARATVQPAGVRT